MTSVLARTLRRSRARRYARPSSSSPAHSRARVGSSLVGDAVGRGDQLEQMPVGILEIHATPAVVVVDLARQLLVRAGIYFYAVSLEAGEAGIEFPIVHQEGIVLRAHVFRIDKIERHAVCRAHRD